MNHKILTLLAIIATLFTSTSCLNNNDQPNIVSYDDTAITSFTLSAVKQVRDTVAKSGKDSTYTVSLVTKNYKFSIDQAEGKIYNVDSLPYGTKVNAVLATITTKNGGVVGIKSLKDETTSVYSSTDSIDFSQERKFYVYANSGKAYKTYTVSINVHKQKSNVFTWKALQDNAAFSSLTATKAVQLGNKVVLIGINGTQTQLFHTANNDGNTWTTGSKTFSTTAFNNFVSQGNALFTLENGQVMRSTDGSTWEVKTPNATLKQLVAATPNTLFALTTNGTLVSSNDNGLTWKNETVTNNTLAGLTTNFNNTLTVTKSGENMSRLLVSGITANGTLEIWTRLVNTANANISYGWNKVESEYSFPSYKNLSLVAYNGNTLALGQNSNNTLAPILVSEDGGLRWNSDKIYTIPTTTAIGTTFAATADSNHYLWIISGTKVWKGILSQLTWTK